MRLSTVIARNFPLHPQSQLLSSHADILVEDILMEPMHGLPRMLRRELGLELIEWTVRNFIVLRDVCP